MSDYQEYDLTPYEEDCAQLGEEDYSERAKLEYTALTEQLIRQFGNPLEYDVWFKRASVPHDFGTYYELRIYFQEWDNNYMSKIDDDFPKHWDAEALEFLKQNNYFRGTND